MPLTYFSIFSMILMAYVLGSIPSAVWIGKRYYGIDIREYGSKNAGTTNMLRVLGRRAALPVFVLDFLKGLVAVIIVRLLKYDELFTYNDDLLDIVKIIAVFAAVLGHIFPVFANFRGGKGVATLVGAVTGMYPTVILLCFGIWLLILMMTHYVSLSSMTAGCCFPIITLISPRINNSIPFVVFSFIVAALLIWTHRKNIKRLREGTESKIYIWKRSKKFETTIDPKKANKKRPARRKKAAAKQTGVNGVNTSLVREETNTAKKEQKTAQATTNVAEGEKKEEKKPAPKRRRSNKRRTAPQTEGANATTDKKETANVKQEEGKADEVKKPRRRRRPSKPQTKEVESSASNSAKPQAETPAVTEQPKETPKAE